ncbi:MAG: hypothetical protein K0S81_681 [Rhodospirillales bacterium]|nr:hypothetical protein [Rhodospirillales bacterium]
MPQDGALAIYHYGELSAMLALTNDKAASGQTRSGHSTVLVAGARNCLYLLLFAGGLVARSR